MLIPMKKVTLIFLKEDKREMLESLQRGGQLMIIPPEEEKVQTDQSVIDADKVKMEQAQSMLRLMNSVVTKHSFFVDRPKIAYSQFMKANERGQEIAAQTSEISQKITWCNTRIATAQSQNDALEPWLDLTIPTKELESGKYVSIFTGFIPENVVQEVSTCIQENDSELHLYGSAPEGRAAVILVYAPESTAVLEEAKEHGFTEAAPPPADVPPRQVYEANEAIVSGAQEELEALNVQLEALTGERNDLELLIQQMVSKESREAIPYSGTLETMTITGWIREDRQEKLQQDVSRVTDVYDLEITDPPEGEKPPTVTQNSKFLASFETITDMFSLPKPGTIDPAPVAGPWYWIIFGMMIGDVGYGAVSIILLWLFRKIKQPRGSFRKLINVLYYSSYMTVFWGVMFGSYFGETWNPIMFSPLDDPMRMLIFVMIIGVLQIFSGMSIKIAEQVRAGKLMDALFDQVSWMVLIVGLGLLFIPAAATAGKWMAIAGAVVILCTAGREKKGIIGKAIGGLLGLYNISSYLSDILSYSRILALALATTVVGMVMNLLAGMVAGSIIGYIAAALILLAGHVFNLAMSTLSAYVHDSRLEYIEFFNQFYEGGGYAFTPLAISEEYYDVLDTDHPQGSDSVTPKKKK
ncbi:MAG: V-type ATP synthase subunit I [Eubacteriaceae bacterium]|jgi:V/A-type H+-transporting ATPase subunit I